MQQEAEKRHGEKNTKESRRKDHRADRCLPITGNRSPEVAWRSSETGMQREQLIEKILKKRGKHQRAG